MHEIIIFLATMAGFYLIGEAAEFASRTMLSWPMLCVAGALWDRKL